MHTADQMMALFRSRFDVPAEIEPTLKEIVEAAVDYAAGMVAAEREACAKIADEMHVRYLPVDDYPDHSDAIAAEALAEASRTIRSRT